MCVKSECATRSQHRQEKILAESRLHCAHPEKTLRISAARSSSEFSANLLMPCYETAGMQPG